MLMTNMHAATNRLHDHMIECRSPSCTHRAMAVRLRPSAAFPWHKACFQMVWSRIT